MQGKAACENPCMSTKPKAKYRYRYRCPYCNRAFKHAGSVQRHKMAGTRRGWCVADPDAARGRT